MIKIHIRHLFWKNFFIHVSAYGREKLIFWLDKISDRFVWHIRHNCLTCASPVQNDCRKSYHLRLKRCHTKAIYLRTVDTQNMSIFPCQKFGKCRLTIKWSHIDTLFSEFRLKRTCSKDDQIDIFSFILDPLKYTNNHIQALPCLQSTMGEECHLI